MSPPPHPGHSSPIRNLLHGDWERLFDELGHEIAGVRGRAGASGLTRSGMGLGADLIEMRPGSAFPLHTHPGDHVLYVIGGSGLVHIDGVDHVLVEGDTILIPADYPHGVRTQQDAPTDFCLLALGVPHRELSSKDRMKLWEPESG